VEKHNTAILSCKSKIHQGAAVYEVDLLREYKTAKYLSKVPTMTG
jgi:hypothetical protein